MKKLSKIIACITSIFCLSTAIACGETPNDEFSVQFYTGIVATVVNG